VYTETLKVKRGDTLFKVAMMYNVTKKELMLVNSLVTEELYEG
jgi:LysM repeat protein